MSRTELQLLGVLLLLYLLDYVRWLRPDQLAYTRRSRVAWKTWEVAPKSFTLLGYIPVLPSLFLWPGLIRTHASRLEPSGLEARLSVVSHQLDSLGSLRTITQLQTILFLIVLPAVTYLRWLTRAWPILLAALLLSHMTLLVLLLRALHRLHLRATNSLIGAVLFNPVGATRILDTVAQRLFDQPSTEASGS